MRFGLIMPIFAGMNIRSGPRKDESGTGLEGLRDRDQSRIGGKNNWNCVTDVAHRIQIEGAAGLRGIKVWGTVFEGEVFPVED